METDTVELQNDTKSMVKVVHMICVCQYLRFVWYAVAL